MNLTALHRRLLADLLTVGTAYPLALTGGYAVQAHGLVNRLSQDLDVATENPDPMEDIASTVRTGLEQRGWQVHGLETDPLSARLIVTDPDSGEACEVDILKEMLWRPPVHTEHGLVLALEDVVGTKVRALADRGLARDLVDVRAAADRWAYTELEELGRRHARDTFELTDLQARLSGADWIDDAEFAAYGLDDDEITKLRRWAQTWADAIAQRLHHRIRATRTDPNGARRLVHCSSNIGPVASSRLWPRPRHTRSHGAHRHSSSLSGNALPA